MSIGDQSMMFSSVDSVEFIGSSDRISEVVGNEFAANIGTTRSAGEDMANSLPNAIDSGIQIG